MSAYEQETVFGFFDAKTLKGDVSTSATDFELSGDGSPSAFGLGLSVGDVNGDGFDSADWGAGCGHQ